MKVPLTPFPRKKRPFPGKKPCFPPHSNKKLSQKAQNEILSDSLRQIVTVQTSITQNAVLFENNEEIPTGNSDPE